MYVVFSRFISRPTSLLASINVSVFLYSIYVLVFKEETYRLCKEFSSRGGLI
jgi:hypothetical protein